MASASASSDRSRPRRTCRVDGSGFYHEMSTKFVDEFVDTEQLVIGDDEELPEDVYFLERIITSRKDKEHKGVSSETLV